MLHWQENLCNSLHRANQAAREFLFGPRLLVCAAVLAAGAAAVAQGKGSMLLLGGLSVFGLSLGVLSGRKAAVVLLTSLPCLFYLYSGWRLPSAGAHDLSRWLDKPDVIFTGRIVEIRAARESPTTAVRATDLVVSPERMLFPDRAELEGKLIVTTYGAKPDLGEGQTVLIKGKLQAPRTPEFPWQLDYSERLRRQGIYCFCRAVDVHRSRSATCRTPGGAGKPEVAKGWLAGANELIASIRERMASVHRKYIGQDEGDLLSSMVLGDRAVQLPDELRHKFRDVGLSHILAASGFNLSLVSGVTWWLARFFIPWGWLVNLLCFISMLGFVCLAGPSPSVMRAAIMISLMLLSRCFFRKLHLPAALAVALLLNLLIDPSSIADVGLQLSYAATAGIIFGAKPLSALLRSLTCTPVPAWLSDSVAVVLLAQASVLPIQLACFWQIGLFFLPANLLVAPLVTPITILGFASSAMVMADFSRRLLEPAAAALDMLVDLPLKLMLGIVNFLASADYARLCLGPPPSVAIAAYYVAFSVLLGALSITRYRRMAMAVFACAVVGLLWRGRLEGTTVACLNGAVAIVKSDRTAVVIGNDQASQVKRVLSYYGVSNRSVKVIAPLKTSKPVRFQVQAGPSVLVIQPESALPSGYSPGLANVVIVKELSGDTDEDTAAMHRDDSVDVLAATIKLSRCACVVLDYSGRADRALIRALDYELRSVPELTILRQDHNEIVLTNASPGYEDKGKGAFISVRN